MPGPSIVNILSVAARTGFANWSAYCMSKFALEGFSIGSRKAARAQTIIIFIRLALPDIGMSRRRLAA
jgi:NAD(P)-dependent dehydrogenase (short-subunit alcohol dehydrogenase family)